MHQDLLARAAIRAATVFADFKEMRVFFTEEIFQMNMCGFAFFNNLELELFRLPKSLQDAPAVAARGRFSEVRLAGGELSPVPAGNYRQRTGVGFCKLYPRQECGDRRQVSCQCKELGGF